MKFLLLPKMFFCHLISGQYEAMLKPIVIYLFLNILWHLKKWGECLMFLAYPKLLVLCWEILAKVTL